MESRISPANRAGNTIIGTIAANAACSNEVRRWSSKGVNNTISNGSGNIILSFFSTGERTSNEALVVVESEGGNASGDSLNETDSSSNHIDFELFDLKVVLVISHDI